MKKQRVAIFASGQGSNAVNIMTYFQNHALIEVAGVVTNNAHAGVIQHAQKFSIPVIVITNEEAADEQFLIDLCTTHSFDFVILAGYLRMIPAAFTKYYDRKIINIHPSLLPKFGGKGMYGDRVHEAVIAAGEKISGITVHFVNAVYDEGEILGQASCELDENESVSSLKEKIASLEKLHFPAIIEQTIHASHA